MITPDEDDLDDPRHYANTVRRVFSDHLKIGVSDQSLKEAKMMQEKKYKKRLKQLKKKNQAQNLRKHQMQWKLLMRHQKKQLKL